MRRRGGQQRWCRSIFFFFFLLMDITTGLNTTEGQTSGDVGFSADSDSSVWSSVGYDSITLASMPPQASSNLVYLLAMQNMYKVVLGW